MNTTPRPAHSIVSLVAMAWLALPLRPVSAADPIVIDFESLPVATGGYYNGDINAGGSVRDPYAIHGTQSKFGSTEYLQSWQLGPASFQNNYLDDPDYPGWHGWSWSQVINPIAPGYGNQYASSAGGGSGGDGSVDAGGTYAVAFTGSAVTQDGSPLEDAVVSFDQSYRFESVDIANTTYVSRYVRDGLDGIGIPDFDANHRFGSGDFLRLLITGYDDVGATGSATGSVTVSLASDADFVLTDWQTIDLSPLGAARSLQFEMTSSQISRFGDYSFLDTPTYVAIDNLRVTAIPEPAAAALIAAAAAGSLIRRRRRPTCPQVGKP